MTEGPEILRIVMSRNQCQQGHQDAEIWMNEWHRESWCGFSSDLIPRGLRACTEMMGKSRPGFSGWFELIRMTGRHRSYMLSFSALQTPWHGTQAHDAESSLPEWLLIKRTALALASFRLVIHCCRSPSVLALRW